MKIKIQITSAIAIKIETTVTLRIKITTKIKIQTKANTNIKINIETKIKGQMASLSMKLESLALKCLSVRTSVLASVLKVGSSFDRALV